MPVIISFLRRFSKAKISNLKKEMKIWPWAHLLYAEEIEWILIIEHKIKSMHSHEKDEWLSHQLRQDENEILTQEFKILDQWIFKGV